MMTLHCVNLLTFLSRLWSVLPLHGCHSCSQIKALQAGGSIRTRSAPSYAQRLFKNWEFNFCQMLSPHLEPSASTVHWWERVSELIRLVTGQGSLIRSAWSFLTRDCLCPACRIHICVCAHSQVPFSPLLPVWRACVFWWAVASSIPSTQPHCTSWRASPFF